MRRRDAAEPAARTRSGEGIRSIGTRFVVFNHKEQDFADRNFIPELKILFPSGITARVTQSSGSEQKGQS